MPDLRRLRAAVLIGGAVLAIAAASYAYLRPDAPAVTASAPAVAGGQTAPSSPSLVYVRSQGIADRPVGGYFTWNLAPPGGGWGGH